MTGSFTVGVLALQGAFAEHLQYLARAAESGKLSKYEFKFHAVRTVEELQQCDGLVIPGGESTSMSLIAERTGMLEPLIKFVEEKPVWGTCAGLIFLASRITNAKSHQKALGGLSVQVARNAFGRQLDSFVTDSDFSAFAKSLDAFPTVFIRAPVVTAILDPVSPNGDAATIVGPKVPDQSNTIIVEGKQVNKEKVEILHALDNGLIVAVRQGNKLGTSFHPELSPSHAFHAWFLEEFIVGDRS